MKIVALAGGVGGAKLVDGLAGVSPAADLSVIVNTGDDFEHLGLMICPDLDTVTYTLAGLANPDTGWGRRDESWAFLDALRALGGPTWFRLGDRVLALHIERTRRLREGESISAVTRSMCAALGVEVKLLPMTDQPVRTRVQTDEGELGFQEYFVEQASEPAVRGFRFQGADQAAPAPGVLEVLRSADRIILCPSNPWVSLDPILAIPGIRAAIRGKPGSGVSPIVGGKAIRGPAAKMFGELGIEPSCLAVAEHFRDLLTVLVIDTGDESLAEPIARLGIQPLVAQTVMRDRSDRLALGRELLEFAAALERAI